MTTARVSSAAEVGDGIVLVDKPAGWTSHDVVARLRGIAGTRRVGHAGTLDPAATGLLVVGIGRGTRLLTHLTGCDKEYEATIRLGVATLTDDAEGSILSIAPPGLAHAVTDEDLATAIRPLTGSFDQIPSAVSAVKVGGRRSYAMVRAGESVELAPRPVEVTRFDVVEVRRGEGQARREAVDVLDVDVVLEVSSGTYVRALARDLGATLGVGGHVTALRRTRVGSFPITRAATLPELEQRWRMLSLGEAAALRFPTLIVTPRERQALARGQAIRADAGAQGPLGEHAALTLDGALVAIVAWRRDALRPMSVFDTPVEIR